MGDRRGFVFQLGSLKKKLFVRPGPTGVTIAVNPRTVSPELQIKCSLPGTTGLIEALGNAEATAVGSWGQSHLFTQSLVLLG